MKITLKKLISLVISILLTFANVTMAFAICENQVPEFWQGAQTFGETAVLAVRVEFFDVKFSDGIYTENQLLSMIDGTSSDTAFPEADLKQYSSLKKYYEQSSYGKLTFSVGKDAAGKELKEIYSFALSQSRDFYEGNDDGEQILIKEVLDGLDGTVDFKNYDLNNDGCIDSILVNFAGETEGRESTWWSHEYNYINSDDSWDGITAKEYVFLSTEVKTSSYGHQTLIHEMGHVLGLCDYYNNSVSELDIGTHDMMSTNTGDHNGFSKWLLGWIEPCQIQWVTPNNATGGSTEVELIPLSSETPAEGEKLIAVITPYSDCDIYSEYFIVEYERYGVGNYRGETGFRIFHIDATLNDEQTDFKNSNTAFGGNGLIRAVGINDEWGNRDEFFSFGDRLTPHSSDSSAFYGGEILGYTGITIDDFEEKNDGSAATFSVVFAEKEKVDSKLNLTLDEEKTDNLCQLVLKSDKPLLNHASFSEKPYLLTENGDKYPVELSVTNSDMYRINVRYSQYLMGKLMPNTSYTLVIPEGRFQLDRDVFSDECRLDINTDDFWRIESEFIYAYDSDILCYSGVFSFNNDKSSFMRIKKLGEEYFAVLDICSDKVTRVSTVEFPIEIPCNDIYIDKIEAITVDENSVALLIDGYSNGNQVNLVYFLNLSERTSAKPYVIDESVHLIKSEHGVKAISEIAYTNKIRIYNFYKNDQTGYVTSVSENEFLADEMNVYCLGNGRYALVNPSVGVWVYDSSDKILCNICYEDFVYVNAVSFDDFGNILVFYTGLEIDNFGGYQCVLKCASFDSDGGLVKQSDLNDFPALSDFCNWYISKAENGYYIKARDKYNNIIHFLINNNFEIKGFIKTKSTDGVLTDERLILSDNDARGVILFCTQKISDDKQEETTSIIVDDFVDLPTQSESASHPQDNENTLHTTGGVGNRETTESSAFDEYNTRDNPAVEKTTAKTFLGTAVTNSKATTLEPASATGITADITQDFAVTTQTSDSVAVDNNAEENNRVPLLFGILGWVLACSVILGVVSVRKKHKG